MTTVRDIFDSLCDIAPLELQMDFDNSGFLVGRREAEVKTVLLSLDVTAEVVDEAIERGAQLIVSHHPLIWNKLSAITDESKTDDKLLRLLENRIAVISMHTNLDMAAGGVNDVLIELLGAQNEGPFDEEGCGRQGRLEKAVSMPSFLSRCKERLRTAGLRY